MLKEFFKKISGVDLLMRLFQIFIFALIFIGLYNTITTNPYTAEQWATLVFAGLAQGSIYALIALGYTLVYGVLLMINFAHGEVFMAGAFSTVFLANYFSKIGLLESSPILSIVILVLFSAAISTVIALLLERIAYRPLRNAPRLIPLITAIGASFGIQYTFRGLYGAQFHSYPFIPGVAGEINVLGFDVPLVQIIVFVAAIILMVLLYWYVDKTKAGKAMRAVSEDKDVARLMGIDINRVIVTTFAIGGALAGAAGVFNGMFRPQGVYFFMGFFPGIKAFTAAVLGGIGNIPGAMIGGLVLGLVESLAPLAILEGLGIPSANQLKDAVAFIMLVLILIYRPQGIFGSQVSSKKA
jgi:branched-chain amino acid transport system permease protein